ncbi:hypothetical protein [Nitrosomonas sp. sh817]|nr:hypothetical protein [Nitrosomonas sp. sh817]WMJ09264.1 hypothetical protein RBH92_03465 [Nitrosomonas sp. sh817]
MSGGKESGYIRDYPESLEFHPASGGAGHRSGMGFFLIRDRLA